MNYTNKRIQELISIVNKKRDVVNSYRPVNKIALLKIKEHFHVKDICNSLRIEGVNYTERETRAILEGVLTFERAGKSAIETLNLNTAVRRMETQLTRRLSLELIKDLHYMCMTNVLPNKECGVFRNNGVIITESSYTPPHSSKVKGLLLDAIKEYNNSEDDKLLSLLRFKHRFTNIHPFFDGNGRVSRLLVNFLLLKNKYVPVIIDSNNKLEYYECLEYADLYFDYRWYYTFMLTQLNITYDMYIKVLNNG